MAKSVRLIDIEEYAVLNKIEWFDFEPQQQTASEFNGTIDISRSEYPNYNNYTQLVTSTNLNDNFYLDKNIEMNKQYRYSFFVNDNSEAGQNISGFWIKNTTSYKPFINNTNVIYNYSTNSFNVTWDAIDTSYFYTNYTLKNYQIYSNEVSANFLLLDFSKCKFKAKYFYKKLKEKGVILRSMEQGYKIKDTLRLTIGSKIENANFIK